MPNGLNEDRKVRALFGAAVKGRRLHLGLTQEELAARAELHRTYVTDIERGARNLSLESIDKLARALQMTIAELFGGTSGDAPGGIECPGSRGKLEILLIEDDADDLELSRHAFRTARLTNPIHAVHDGAEALAFLADWSRTPASAERPGTELLVLLDLHLPKVSGLDVLRQIRREPRTRDLPVVVLTCSEKGQDIAECQRLGCSHYLVKPVGFAGLSRITPQLRLDWRLLGRPPGTCVADSHWTG